VFTDLIVKISNQVEVSIPDEHFVTVVHQLDHVFTFLVFKFQGLLILHVSRNVFYDPSLLAHYDK